jgi:hypothetical protein
MNQTDSEAAKRRSLVEAGYEFRPIDNLWVNALLDRQLDGGIAQGLTVEQLTAWIKAAGSRTRMPSTPMAQASQADRPAPPRNESP